MRLRNTYKRLRAMPISESKRLTTLADGRADENWRLGLTDHGSAPSARKLTLADVKWVLGMTSTQKSQGELLRHLENKVSLDADARAYVSGYKTPAAAKGDFLARVVETSIAQHGQVTLKDFRSLWSLVNYELLKPGGISGGNVLTDPHYDSALTPRGVGFVKSLLAKDDASGKKTLEPALRTELTKALDRQAEALDMKEKDYRGPAPMSF
jgi:hypothetical protein